MITICSECDHIELSENQACECPCHTPGNKSVTLSEALRESVALQSHYAQLLNMHDGGQRMIFESAESWIERLNHVRRG